MEIRSIAKIKQLMRLSLKLLPGEYSLSEIASNMTKNRKDYGNVFTNGMIDFLKESKIIIKRNGKYYFDRYKLWGDLSKITLNGVPIEIKLPFILTEVELSFKTWRCEFDG